MTKVYSIVSNKGGVLKTTLSVNIAAELSKSYRVLIIDTDGQSNVGVTFGVKSEDVIHTLFDCLSTGLDPMKAILNVSNNLDIILSGKEMNIFTPKKGNSIMGLKEVVGKVKKGYDFIFIDTSPTMNFAALQTLVASDEIIIPFEPEGYGMISIIDTIRGIQEVKNSVNPELKINSIVVTKYNSRSKVHNKFIKDMKEVSEKMKIHLSSTKIPQTTTGSKSILEEQKPTVLSSKWYKLKGIYANLAKEVIR